MILMEFFIIYTYFHETNILAIIFYQFFYFLLEEGAYYFQITFNVKLSEIE